MVWAAAEQRCRSMGSHLASVTSQETHDFLHLHVSEEKNTFLSESVLGEDPKEHLDWWHRPTKGAQLDLD